MRRRKAIVLAALLSLVVASVVIAGVGANYAIEWDVIAGGGRESTGTTYGTHGTIGQGAIGISTGASYGVRGGFWYGVAAPRAYYIYLPIVLKNYSP
jgi:hypothetical protein